MRRRIVRQLIDAIETSSIVRVTYKNLIYELEIYNIWANKRGKYYCHCYKRSGGYLKNPADHFGDFIVREITSVEPIGVYKYPLIRYNPRSKRFYRIIHQWSYKP